MKSQVMPIFLTFLLRLYKSGEGFITRFLCFDFAGATVEFAEGMNGVAGNNMDAETGSVVVFSSRDTCVLEAEISSVGSSLRDRSTCVPGHSFQHKLCLVLDQVSMKWLPSFEDIHA